MGITRSKPAVEKKNPSSDSDRNENSITNDTMATGKDTITIGTEMDQDNVEDVILRDLLEEEKEGQKKKKQKKFFQTYRTFSVVKKQWKENDEQFEATYIELKDYNVQSILQNVLGTSSEINFYQPKNRILESQFYPHIPEMKEAIKLNKYNEAISELLEYLEEKTEDLKKSVIAMLKEKKISFEGLWYVFHKGKEVYSSILDDKQTLAFKVDKVRYGCFMFFITGEVLRTDGEQFYAQNYTFDIPFFRKPTYLANLPVQLMTKEVKEILTERGRKFAQLAKGHHHRKFTGGMILERMFGCSLIKASGRIMVDPVTYSYINGTNGKSIHQNQAQNQAQNLILKQQMRNQAGQSGDPCVNSIPDDKLWTTWPTVTGFSFNCKKWGEFPLTGIEEIVFDDLAFQRLVAEEKEKRILLALVQRGAQKVTDFISEKGGGQIFLLHGNPGVGKTLTAEAISEVLHKPLYSITMGELGTTPVALEEKLSVILEVASRWNAVILIDEADIFLEERSKDDITRNAMVGIFLRLLEYHQGVLFLTTNRVKCFDRAFHSRITLFMHYKDLDEDSRDQVWKNFLDLLITSSTSTQVRDPKDSLLSQQPNSEVLILDYQPPTQPTQQFMEAMKQEREKFLQRNKINTRELAKFEFNGRQIRNCIKLATSMSETEGTELNMSHLLCAAQLTHQLQSETPN